MISYFDFAMQITATVNSRTLTTMIAMTGGGKNNVNDIVHIIRKRFHDLINVYVNLSICQPLNNISEQSS